MKRSIALTIAVITTSILGSTGLMSRSLKNIHAAPTAFLPLLSGYHIFKTPQKDLQPETAYHPYALATPLFTDYAEKQRLICLPQGTRMIKTNEELPEFPDSTIIVKTFYYYNDKRDTANGKQIIETRLLVRSAGEWKAATYRWNDAQTDAFLLKSSQDIPVRWITPGGEQQYISYHVPNTKECTTCHNANDQLMPIGLRLRNLNFDILNNNQPVNQLKHLQDIGILNEFDPHRIAATAKAFNVSHSLADRARAYLDINCAHCHNPGGSAKRTGLFLSYGLPIDQTGIIKKKEKIIRKFQKGKMPRLGTTIIHAEALQLLKDYINDLH
ncbi:hypothetical protein Q4E93_15020 [Flavitalea sp. BT771]|uniref:hypothetical protein n=1 Tax=Flavitalea sp. BT771 TaxID=3063329 RepID=UPI0026E2FED8|nr:hypothetical protein [Flavitalea sp. BT771]MDO6431916.1 hypothetical protein [Flavitalea sp. BT771]MDV6220825.1 hypothetical protein [Flavitalea sp. BT771]